MNSDALAEAAPLWLGTVAEIDDVLPQRAGMFDLVILDEASQIDQIASAGALLRARQAVVCGDPRQLRHVSFVSDSEVEAANERWMASRHARIDVRRNSTLDQAVPVGVVVNLDTHYRSVPHLIGFSATRFYEDRLTIATGTPINDHDDRIDVRTVLTEPVDGESGDTARCRSTRRRNRPSQPP